MNAKRALSLLSLASRAGKLASGETACEAALRAGQAALVVICADASDNTKKKFVNKAYYYQVPVVMTGEKAVLSRAAGKENRAVFVLTDAPLAHLLREAFGYISSTGSTGEGPPS